jgi:hypothetical protein
VIWPLKEMCNTRRELHQMQCTVKSALMTGRVMQEKIWNFLTIPCTIKELDTNVCEPLRKKGNV